MGCSCFSQGNPQDNGERERGHIIYHVALAGASVGFYFRAERRERRERRDVDRECIYVGSDGENAIILDQLMCWWGEVGGHVWDSVRFK